jgi:hypothetical protein
LELSKFYHQYSVKLWVHSSIPIGQ